MATTHEFHEYLYPIIVKWGDFFHLRTSDPDWDALNRVGVLDTADFRKIVKNSDRKYEDRYRARAVLVLTVLNLDWLGFPVHARKGKPNFFERGDIGLTDVFEKSTHEFRCFLVDVLAVMALTAKNHFPAETYIRDIYNTELFQILKCRMSDELVQQMLPAISVQSFRDDSFSPLTEVFGKGGYGKQALALDLDGKMRLLAMQKPVIMSIYQDAIFSQISDFGSAMFSGLFREQVEFITSTIDELADGNFTNLLGLVAKKAKVMLARTDWYAESAKDLMRACLLSSHWEVLSIDSHNHSFVMQAFDALGDEADLMKASNLPTIRRLLTERDAQIAEKAAIRRKRRERVFAALAAKQ